LAKFTNTSTASALFPLITYPLISAILSSILLSTLA